MKGPSKLIAGHETLVAVVVAVAVAQGGLTRFGKAPRPQAANYISAPKMFERGLTDHGFFLYLFSTI